MCNNVYYEVVLKIFAHFGPPIHLPLLIAVERLRRLQKTNPTEKNKTLYFGHLRANRKHFFGLFICLLHIFTTAELRQDDIQ